MANAKNITVKESLASLKALLKSQPIHKSSKIKMLLEIKKSSTSLSKISLAEKIGVAPASVQTWRLAYVNYGIDGLLKDDRGGYKPSLITADAHKKIELKLNSTEAAFSSYKQLHDWVMKEFTKEIKYNSLRHYVKRNFGAKLKVPRKSHIKKDKEAVAAFKKTSKITASKK